MSCGRVNVNAGPVSAGTGCLGCLAIVAGAFFVAMMIIVIGTIFTGGH